MECVNGVITNIASQLGDYEEEAHLMGRMTIKVRVLLQELQDQRKEELDEHQLDFQFAVPVGDYK